MYRVSYLATASYAVDAFRDMFEVLSQQFGARGVDSHVFRFRHFLDVGCLISIVYVWDAIDRIGCSFRRGD